MADLGFLFGNPVSYMAKGGKGSRDGNDELSLKGDQE
jgi:hypothetical protein